MAQNYRYKKSAIEKFNIKGDLSDDGKIITYINGDKEEKTIAVDKCFSQFGGMPIEFTLVVKSTQDLED